MGSGKSFKYGLASLSSKPVKQLASKLQRAWMEHVAVPGCSQSVLGMKKIFSGHSLNICCKSTRGNVRPPGGGGAKVKLYSAGGVETVRLK